MLWVGVDGLGLCGNHQNVESSGTRCFLKPQEKKSADDNKRKRINNYMYPECKSL